MSFIDVHCHLDGETYGNLEVLIQRCADNGVERIITVGFDVPSSVMCAEIAQKYDCVYFTAGCHPTELDGFREADLDEIGALCREKKCVALGEIGLDYHYPDTRKELQREVFLRQLEIADALGLPVQIHSRDCAEDMTGVLKENVKILKSGALMHCFSHSTETAEELAKLGLYFSFGGASTWKGAKKAVRTIRALPEGRILTETDSPYMAPQSVYKSFPNTPLAIPEILRSIADSRGVTAEYMEERVLKNARELFKKLG